MRSRLNQPLLIMLYGLPGAGKTTLAKNLSNLLGIACIDSDRVRHELFDKAEYTAEENAIVNSMCLMMTEQLLKCGVSVVNDISNNTFNERRMVRELARNNKADSMLIWLQIDTDSALMRRKSSEGFKDDEKFLQPMPESSFSSIISSLQNPEPSETYFVISGKHTFNSQKPAILRRLLELKLINLPNTYSSNPGPQVLKPIDLREIKNNNKDSSSTRPIDFHQKNFSI